MTDTVPNYLKTHHTGICSAVESAIETWDVDRIDDTGKRQLDKNGEHFKQLLLERTYPVMSCLSLWCANKICSRIGRNDPWETGFDTTRIVLAWESRAGDVALQLAQGTIGSFIARKFASYRALESNVYGWMRKRLLLDVAGAMLDLAQAIKNGTAEITLKEN